MKLTKEQLKPLIKMVLTEMARRRSGANGDYDEHEIELDNLAIPGICEAGDYVLITATIQYNADPGYPDRGMFGPPEYSEQGEGPSVEIVNQYPTSLKVVNAAGQETEYDDFSQWPPESVQILNAAVEQDVNQNQSDIESKILDTIDFDYDPRDEPDDDRDR
jgi:hypothetical protein